MNRAIKKDAAGETGASFETTNHGFKHSNSIAKTQTGDDIGTVIECEKEAGAFVFGLSRRYCHIERGAP